MNWIHLFQHRIRWRVLVNAAMKYRVPEQGGFINWLDNYQFLKKDCAPKS
jgi:hypothetical protein